LPQATDHQPSASVSRRGSGYGIDPAANLQVIRLDQKRRIAIRRLHMDLFETIRLRHSYRDEYLPDPVPREDLRGIVQAGIQAPSGCNAQSTTFVIVDDPAVLKQLREILSVTAPALIVCVADPSPVYHGTSFEKEDCAAAVENMLLAITALGYASVWLDGVLRAESRAEKLGKLLGVPAGKRVQVVLPVGRPREKREQRERKPFDQRAWFNRYGS